MISRGHRRRLNRAMHELRRPLQALALIEDGRGAPGASGEARAGLLELARGALAELEAAVNGGAVPAASREVRCRELVMAAIERWRPAAAGAGGIRLYWDAGPAALRCDPVGVSRALDNLLANAVEHGGPPLVVTGARVAGRVRITIANGAEATGGAAHEAAGPAANGGAAARAERFGGLAARGDRADGAAGGGAGRRRGGPDPRRGHGIELVSEVADRHRGRFALCRTDSGCVAALEFPLSGSGLARAA